MSTTANNKSDFTKAEEKRIEAEVQAYQEKVREAEIQAEINNRILDAERKQPGKRF
jgi:hypothetical protein